MYAILPNDIADFYLRILCSRLYWRYIKGTRPFCRDVTLIDRDNSPKTMHTDNICFLTKSSLIIEQYKKGPLAINIHRASKIVNGIFG